VNFSVYNDDKFQQEDLRKYKNDSFQLGYSNAINLYLATLGRTTKS